jgi:hypothetical protein
MRTSNQEHTMSNQPRYTRLAAIARALIVVIAITPLARALAQTTATPAPKESPVGLYDWRMKDREKYATLPGVDATDEVTGTLDLMRMDGGYHAILTSSIGPTFPARWVGVENDRVTVLAETPYGLLSITMNIGPDSIPARWAMNGGVMDIDGRLEIRRRR